MGSIFKALKGAETKIFLKNPNFLDFKGQNKRFLDCITRLTSIK